jgi:hypothetical protein
MAGFGLTVVLLEAISVGLLPLDASWTFEWKRLHLECTVAENLLSKQSQTAEKKLPITSEVGHKYTNSLQYEVWLWSSQNGFIARIPVYL